jgi:hypothetical protein
MEKVHKVSEFRCHTPLSKPYRIALYLFQNYSLCWEYNVTVMLGPIIILLVISLCCELLCYIILTVHIAPLFKRNWEKVSLFVQHCSETVIAAYAVLLLCFCLFTPVSSELAT